jgi:hypothetical protein
MGKFKEMINEDKKLKVGPWWNKLDSTQQKAFQEIFYKSQYPDINGMRKFFTSAKKKFVDNINYVKNGVIIHNGKTYFYSHDNDSWSEQ